MVRHLAAALAFIAIATPATARTPVNPQIDYEAFVRLAAELAPVRASHRLEWNDFIARARAGNAVLLDARSAKAFAQGHIKGAVNLPLPDFTDEALRRVLGHDPDRPIYIYCNNNFTDHRAPIPLKRAPMALNVPTFINLHGYGYRNVWELAGLVTTADPKVGWVGTRAAR
jgi:hypothetical protein